MRRIRLLKTAAFPRRRASPLSSALCHVLQAGPHIRRHRSYYFGSIQRSILEVYNTYPQAPQLPHSFTFIPRRSPQLHLPSCTSLNETESHAPVSRKIAKNDNIDTKRNNRDKKVPELQPPAPPMLCYTSFMQHAPKQMHMYLC